MTSPKAYAVACHGGGEFRGAPALAVFSIEKETAAKIVHLAQSLILLDALKIIVLDNRVRWFEHDLRDELDADQLAEYEAAPLKLLELGEGQEMRSDLGSLVVYKDDFHFQCVRKHEDAYIVTASQSIAVLAAKFDLPWAFKSAEHYLEARLDGKDDPRFARRLYEESGRCNGLRLPYYSWLLRQYEANGIAFEPPPPPGGPASYGGGQAMAHVKKAVVGVEMSPEGVEAT